MKKQVDYRVIVDRNSNQKGYLDEFLHFTQSGGEGGFYSIIKEYMNDGWVCQGGVTARGGWYYQTMVKYED